NGFDRGFQWLSVLYGNLVKRLVAFSRAMGVFYALLIAAMAYLLVTTPKGFIPAQDRGYVIAVAQLPAGASLARTTEIAHKAETIALSIEGVDTVPLFSGLSGVTGTLSPNTVTLFPIMKPAEERLKHGRTADVIAQELREKLAAI